MVLCKQRHHSIKRIDSPLVHECHVSVSLCSRVCAVRSPSITSLSSSALTSRTWSTQVRSPQSEVQYTPIYMYCIVMFFVHHVLSLCAWRRNRIRVTISSSNTKKLILQVLRILLALYFYLNESNARTRTIGTYSFYSIYKGSKALKSGIKWMSTSIVWIKYYKEENDYDLSAKTCHHQAAKLKIIKIVLHIQYCRLEIN